MSKPLGTLLSAENFRTLVPELQSKRFRFLVTGGAGFIGSHIAETLIGLNQEVVVLDSLVNGRRENLPNDVRFIEGDIRNVDAVDQAVKGADFVLHQAALGSVPRSLTEPVLFHDVNVTGTLNVFEAARRHSVKRVVYASSSSVYGSTTQHPNTEGCEGELLSPYALTKHANEKYAQMQSKAFGFSTVGLRYFNVFGPRQNPNSQYAAVIPKFITSLLKNEAPTIYGDGEASRDFTFVQNVVYANLIAGFADLSSIQGDYRLSAMNVACGHTTSVNDLFSQIARLLDSQIVTKHVSPRAGDIRYSYANIERARRLLKFEPQVEIADGLSVTVEWYKKFGGKS